MNATFSTPAAARLQRLLVRYIELRKSDVSEIVQKKAKSLSIELYRATKEAAPTKARIKQDVVSRGWKVKRKPGGWPRKPGEKRGSKGPLNRMRASVIKRRQKAIGFAASGFLPALDGLGAKASAKDAANFPRPKGKVEIAGLNGLAPQITITNSTPGIASVEAKHHITRAAFNAVSADIVLYIRRKTEETASKLRN